MSPVLTAASLEVRYGGRTVVALEHLGLEPGVTLALLGPNGAGKSTLLRVLALLERPAAGQLGVLGEPVGGSERQRLRLRRRMATVFQAPLLMDASVYDNVALGLRLRGLGEPALRPRVERWLARLGIAALARSGARTLSGGEAQRASLARALVLEPEVLFLDEPFASLDPHGREALALELEPILREAGIATVLVTHDRNEAMLLADEAAVMIDGRLRQRDPAPHLLAHPVDEEVARFLGVENLLPALVRRAPQGGDLGEVELGSQCLRVRLPPGRHARVLLCLRAEDVHLGPGGGGGGGGADPGSIRIPGHVVRVLPAGVPFRVQLDAGFPLVALAARRNVERLGLAPGTAVVASVDPAAIHVVPAGREPPPALPH